MKRKGKRVRALRIMWCDECDGTGWVEGGKALQTQCSKCKGEGRVLERIAKGGKR